MPFNLQFTTQTFGISNFGYCDLFDICDLDIGICRYPLHGKFEVLGFLKYEI